MQNEIKTNLDLILRKYRIYETARVYSNNGVYFAFLYCKVNNQYKVIKEVSANKIYAIRFVVDSKTISIVRVLC